MRINGIKFITKNFSHLKDKNIVVFASGASPFTEEVVNKVRNSNFRPDQQNHIKFFYLRGGFNYSKLNAVDKILMKVLKFILERKAVLTPEEKGLLSAYNKPADFTRRRNMEGLITYVNNLE